MDVGERKDEVVEKLALRRVVVDFVDDDEGLDPLVGEKRLRQFSEELLHERGEVVDADVAPVVLGAAAVVLLLQVVA